jgi:hypothetical protein
MLHNRLDELIADWIGGAPGHPLPSKNTVLELMEWSKRQSQEPDHAGPANISDEL